MRIAAIDIGTNSVHMIVVQVRPDLSFEVIDREKEMVRLGAGGLDGRALTPEAMHAALQVLSKFRRLAESHKVDEVIAVATSATREAENGGEFLQAVTQQTGIRPRVISGTEEARLIHLAAVYGVSVPGDVAVVIDIGGGSVEVTRGAGPAIELGRSFKLGVIRLTERFVKTDPLEPRDERKLVRHIDAEIGKYLDQISRAGFERVIGTSGTILSLGAVASAAEGLAPGSSLRNRRFTAKQIRRVRKDLVALDLEKRLRVPGLEPRRADLAVAGAILLDELLRRLGANEITLCDLSLREGLVLDYISRHRKEIAQADRYPDVRRRSVFELAERCNYWPEHSQQVARLAIGAVRSDARDSRPDRSRARVARVRGDPARHRRAHLLRGAPQALLLPGQERRSARLRAGRNRGDRAGRALSPPGDAEAQARRLQRSEAPHAPHRPHAGGDPAARRKPRSQPRADHHRPRAARSRRRRPAAAAHHRRRGAGALGGDAPRRAFRTLDRQAAPHRGQRPSHMLNNLTQPHEYPGKLFVVEGIDGSGKTTQLALLAKWLSAEGHRVFVTEWNSSALVKAATKTGKKKNALTPMTFSLLHATDFADRLLYKIIPPLKAGMIVLADRYAYTAFARDATRGVDRQWVRELYSFAVRPDLALYFRVPIDVSVDRLMARRVKLKFYEAGMDLGWSSNPLESFRLFQGKVLDEYDQLVNEFGMEVIDARGSITEQQRLVRNVISAAPEFEPRGDHR